VLLTKTGEWGAPSLCIFDEMTKLTKTLASASVAGFVAGGIIDFGGFNVASALLLVLPLGAVFFRADLDCIHAGKRNGEVRCGRSVETAIDPTPARRNCGEEKILSQRVSAIVA
jgi:hypothetical protein